MQLSLSLFSLNLGKFFLLSVFNSTPLVSLLIFIFFLSLIGICLAQLNVIWVLLCLEMALFSISALFVIFGNFGSLAEGYVFSLTVLALAASEAAVGFSILFLIQKQKNLVVLANQNLLRY